MSDDAPPRTRRRIGDQDVEGVMRDGVFVPALTFDEAAKEAFESAKCHNENCWKAVMEAQAAMDSAMRNAQDADRMEQFMLHFAEEFKRGQLAYWKGKPDTPGTPGLGETFDPDLRPDMRPSALARASTDVPTRPAPPS